MKRTTKILMVLLSLCLPALSGCGFRIAATNPIQQIKQGKFQSCQIDDKNCAFAVTYSNDPNSNDPNSRQAHISWPDYAIEPNEPVTVSYLPLEFVFGARPLVNGKLDNGKSVSLMVDTGCNAHLMIWDSVVRSRKIPVWPFENKAGGMGVCDIQELKIGGLTLRNPPCFLVSQHFQLHLMGLELWKDDVLLLGMPVLKHFKYVAFDNAAQQVTFSKNEPFAAIEPNLWAGYPFVLKNEPNSFPESRIEMTIPLAGENTKIGFDSGGAFLVMKETPFEILRGRLDILSEKKEKFLSIQRGSLDSRQVRVRNLTIGNNTLKRAKIVVLPDDTDYLPETEPGYLSLREFKDTTIVLDFEKNLMWIKKAKGGRWSG